MEFFLLVFPFGTHQKGVPSLLCSLLVPMKKGVRPSTQAGATHEPRCCQVQAGSCARGKACARPEGKPSGDLSDFQGDSLSILFKHPSVQKPDPFVFSGFPEVL